MPDLNGIEATRRIVATADAPRVLVLTTFDHDRYVFDALAAGASGFLLFVDGRPSKNALSVQGTAELCVAGRTRSTASVRVSSA